MLGNIYFNVCTLGILVYNMSEGKTERIIIRCTPQLYKRWKIFLLENRDKFKTSSDALEYLLSIVKVSRITRY